MGTIIIQKSTGLEFEMLELASGDPPLTSTHFINQDGAIRLGGNSINVPATWLRLLSKRHTFGGVVYEETGEERWVQQGEYYMGTPERVYYWEQKEETLRDFTILKPIGTISEDGKVLHRNDGTSEAVNQC